VAGGWLFGKVLLKMALVARIVPANGGRIIEKRLGKVAGKLAVPDGARLEIVDSETGMHVRPDAANASEQGLLLTFATVDGDVALELSGAVAGFAEALAEAAFADAAASADATAADQVSEEPEADTASESGDDGAENRAGFSPVLLGILGLGALGGIATAVGSSGGSSEKDTTPPAAPASLALAEADDTGASASDGITKNGSGLTISGKAEAQARIELFDGATSLGTVTADASGNFTLDVVLPEGVHSITAKAADAAGNVSAASSALNVTVDTTAPSAAIAMSATELAEGETATVTITFSEPVTNFGIEDLTVGSGTLSGLVSSDGGLTWTATFTPDENVTDLTNVIALGADYTDIAGNAGAAAVSDNYAVETLTFTVSDGDSGSVDFGGSATGPITITLNGADEAVFSRGGKLADSVVGSISTKTMNVPEGGELNIAIDGEAASDTFTLNAPNAATLVFTGNGGALDDALNIIIESATDNPDLRTLKIDTSQLTGVETIRFVFPEDARDVVKLTADSNLSGFSTIEVSKGGVDLTSVEIQPGVEFIVNSTLIVTLDQFEKLSSIVSVTGLGKLSINLTAEEVQSHALENFLASNADKPLLIGTTVTVHNAKGASIPVPEGLDAISYDGIPGLSDRIEALEHQVSHLGLDDIADLGSALNEIDRAIAALEAAIGNDGELAARIAALEGKLDGIADTVTAYVDEAIGAVQEQLDDLGIDGVTDLAGTLAALQTSINALNTLTGEGGDLDARIAGLEDKLDGITDTVVDYVRELVDGLKNDAEGEEGPTLDSIAGLRSAVEALQDLVGEDGPLSGQLSDLQSQIDDIASHIDTVAPTVLDVELSATGADVEGHLNAGDVVTATVHFSEAVLVTGHPTLQLMIGDDIVDATLVGGAGTDVLTFSYTVREQDYDADGISVGEDALKVGEDSGITDKAGNAVDWHFAGAPAGSSLIVDNGPLHLERSALDIFGATADADSVIVGVLYSEEEGDDGSLVTLAQFDAEGRFEVPEGRLYLSYQDWLIATADGTLNEPNGQTPNDWIADHLIASGETVSINLDDALVVRTGESSPGALFSEAALLAFLQTDGGKSALEEVGLSAEAFLSEFSRPLSSLYETLSPTITPEFLAQIVGHDPADVILNITTPLTVAQATALAEAGFDLGDNVGYSIADYYTSVQAALGNPAQAAALQHADQVLSRGDELDNLVSMTSFNPLVNLRSELGDGNDVYNSGRGDEEILGQHGGDTINLTYNDNSHDTITFESVLDGRTGSVIDVIYSTNEKNYREGSIITVTINGHEYAYTTTASGEDGETPAEALQHLADAVMAKQVGNDRVMVGISYRLDHGDLIQDGFIYEDELTNGSYTVQSGHYFLSASEYFGLIADGEDVDLAAFVFNGLRGGQTFTLTDEDYFKISNEEHPAYSSTLFEGQTVLVGRAAFEDFLKHYAEDFEAPEALQAYMEDAERYRDVTHVSLDADHGKLTFTGDVPSHETSVEAGFAGWHDDQHDQQDAIENPGQSTKASITFSSGEDDYPALVHEGDLIAFDRELRVTISGKTITANVMPGDPEASVEALRQAVLAAMDPESHAAITAAHATIDLGASLTEDSELDSYELTLAINGITVTLKDDDGATVADLIAAIRGVGGVESVELDGQNLIITGEVRGEVAEENSVLVSVAKLDGEDCSTSATAAVGGSLSDLISGIERDETTLIFTGFVPDTDDDAPAFTIDSGEIDKAGVQQVVTVNFSNDDADYYAGGKLHVTVNGQPIEADMVAGSAHDSMQALVVAINEAVGEDSSGAMLLDKAVLEPLSGGVSGQFELHLVSSVERPDALQLTDVKQDYRGEEQTATISLEDAFSYTAQAGEHAADADRFANVYYEGGKVYATFVPRVDDGNGGLMDGEPVTVSADMVIPGATSAIAISVEAWYYIDLKDLSLTIDGREYTEDDFADYLSDMGKQMAGSSVDPSVAAKFAYLRDWLETLDGVEEATVTSNGAVTITYAAGVTGTIDALNLVTYDKDLTWLTYDSTLTQSHVTNSPGAAFEATAQALADAINAAAHQVVHFGFDMGNPAHEALSLETALATSDSANLILMQVGIDDFQPSISQNGGAEGIETVGDLLDFLNGEYAGHGVWSLNAAGNGLDLTVAADAVVDTSVPPVIGLGDVTDLFSALDLVTTDEATLPFIGHAEVGEDGTITVTAAEVGKDTFEISHVNMDYEGVHQIATAHFDSDANYYVGGTVSIDIDTTPGEDGGIVHVQANMVAGDRAATLQNLVDEINSYTVGGEDANTAAQIVLFPGADLSDETTNGGGNLDGKLYVSSWSVTVGVGEDAHTYSGHGEAVVADGVVAEWNELSGPDGHSVFNDLSDFLGYISNLPGVGEATLGEDGSIVITSEAAGGEAYVSASFDVALFANDLNGPHLTGSASDYGSSGALAGIIDHAVLGEDGQITLVSADAAEQQFSIVGAEVTKEPVRQEATAHFDHDSEDYFEGGKIGITVNGVTVETDMLMKPASANVSAMGGEQLIDPSVYVGSIDSETFAFSITVDGTTYDEANFAAYLAQLPTPLTIPNGLGFTNAPTFQNLADWVMTLDGVDKVTFDPANGLVITFDPGSDGQINSLVGRAYPSPSGVFPMELSEFLETGHTSADGSGDPEATLEALRGEIWQQVTHATGVIEVGDSWTEETTLEGETTITSLSQNPQMTSGLGMTVGQLLTWMRGLPDVASAELVDGKIVITAVAGQAPFNFEISNDNFASGTLYWHIGNDLYGAFSSVTGGEGGNLHFTAADPVDGYGEINVTDVFMSVPALEQITHVDLSDVNFATGLHSETGDGGNPAQVSITVAGHSITAETQENDSDTVRALAQAIIEARDGVYAGEAVVAEAGDTAAIVRINLPDGVDGDTRLVKDEFGHATEITFAARFSNDPDAPVFTFVSEPTLDMSVSELIEILNGALENWATAGTPARLIGSFSYDADANQIVLTSHAKGADAYVAVDTAFISEFWNSGEAHIQANGADAVLSRQFDPVTSGEDGLEQTEIDLPDGVTGGSWIHGVEGNFPLAEALTNIQVTFTVDGQPVTFAAPPSLDHDMTVAAFIAALDDQLTVFETENQTGDVGTFSFEDGQILFTPASDNADLTSYQVTAFGISDFVAQEHVMDPGGGMVAVGDLADTGESGVQVMHSDNRTITAGDPISMDLVEVVFTIDGVEQSATFRPELFEQPGETGSTVGDFLAWVENHFDGAVQAEIVDGDIVFSGTGGHMLGSADVSLELLDATRSWSSEAVGLPEESGSSSSITLDAFAGLSGDELLVGESVDFDIYVGGATAGMMISVSYEIGEDSTVADLLDYIESYAASQTGGTAYLNATLGEDGIELSVNGGPDRLWVSALSLTVEQARTGQVSDVADKLGTVHYNGEDGIDLHGNGTGPDQIHVGGFSYEHVDTESSTFQQIVVEFNNTKLDDIANGAQVSLTLLGHTTKIFVSTDGTPGDGEVDVSTALGNARSNAILEALVTQLRIDHPNDALDLEIVRGYRDPDNGNAFVEDSIGGSSVVLKLTADEYGQHALGNPQDIVAKIINQAGTGQEQFSVVAEEIHAGVVHFITGSDGGEIHDGTDWTGQGQAGRDQSTINYHDNGGEDSTGSYTIIDGNGSHTLGEDHGGDYVNLDINDDSKAGVGPGSLEQDYTNPGDDPSYYGEAGATGASGVEQTHQNPDGGYTAIDGSPVYNDGNVSTGEDSLHGGAAGYYDSDGLHTDHHDGQTPVAGEDYYEGGSVDSHSEVDGAWHGQSSDSDSGEDGFHVDEIRDGFAAFTWDNAIHHVVANASAQGDIINHFQVGYDVINIDGALRASTAVGEVDRMLSDGYSDLDRRPGPHIDLDFNEFGLVTQAGNHSAGATVDTAHLSNAHDIASLLSDAFYITADGEDDQLNTTIFAVTAEDDPNSTAIWVHTQSSAGDGTIDANELTMLAIVHSTGGDFGMSNLQMLQYHYDAPPPP